MRRGGHLFVAVIAVFVNVPDRQSRTRKRRITPFVLPVLDDEIFAVVFFENSKLVFAGGQGNLRVFRDRCDF